jgi:hypothetical protein
MNWIQAIIEDWKKPDNAPAIVAIVVSVAFAFIAPFLSFIKTDQKIVFLCSGILLALSGVTKLLLSTHNVIRCLQERLEHPDIDENIRPFNDFHEEILERIEHADEIWLLSRTGRGWWKYYFEEFFERSGNNIIPLRFLFIDPDSPAVTMIKEGSVPEWEDPNCYSLENSMRNFLDMLKRNMRITPLKVMNYLPPWTMLIINPNKRNKHSAIYVELGRYGADHLNRDTFKIRPGVSSTFDTYIQEYNNIWDHPRLTREY